MGPSFDIPHSLPPRAVEPARQPLSVRTISNEIASPADAREIKFQALTAVLVGRYFMCK